MTTTDIAEARRLADWLDGHHDLIQSATMLRALADELERLRAQVAVPLDVLEDASEAIGHFVSDLGWGDADMQAMDNLDAYIARHKANAAAPAQQAGEWQKPIGLTLAAPSLTVEGGKWEGAEEWMPLAWELCANECGEEACSELIWEGGPIPEPWGDRWLKYEDQAKEMIAMVRKHVPAPQLAAQAEPVAWIEHDYNGTGQRRLHFERRPATVRDEVIAPIWTPLVPASNPPAQGAGERVSPEQWRALIDAAEKAGELRGRNEERAKRLGLAQAPAAEPQWQPIETLPDDQLAILYGAKRSEMVIGMRHSRDGWVIDTPSEWASMYPPKLWMPLPPAPEFNPQPAGAAAKDLEG